MSYNQIKILLLILIFSNSISASLEEECLTNEFKDKILILSWDQSRPRAEQENILKSKLEEIENKLGYKAELGLKMSYLIDKESLIEYMIINKTSDDRPHHGDLAKSFTCQSPDKIDFVLGGYIKVKSSDDKIKKIQLNNRSLLKCSTKEDLRIPEEMLSNIIKKNKIKLIHGPNRKTCTASGIDKKNHDLPKPFSGLEIEAKWSIDNQDYDALSIMKNIYKDLSDAGRAKDILKLKNLKNDSEVEVRWDGRPAKFVDHYYLSKDFRETTLRHRTRYSSDKVKKNVKGELEDLRNGNWEFDWEKIQFKKSPHIDEAIWFREELGNCFVNHKKRSSNLEKMCSTMTSATASDFLEYRIEHPAIVDLPSYIRPEIGFKRVFKIVEDYRYRIIINSKIEFFSNDEIKDRNFQFELSLDRVFQKTCEWDEELADCQQKDPEAKFEVELEILDNDGDEEEAIYELYRLSKLIQDKYQLIPSTRHKGSK